MTKLNTRKINWKKDKKLANATIITKNISETKIVEGVKISFIPITDWLLKQ